MPSALPFRRVAILGTGLIGGSFGLALRRHFPEIRVAGFDRDDVLQRALARDALHESATTIKDAVLGADLVYIALPLGETISSLSEIAASCHPKALVTDASGAKSLVCRSARHLISGPARFLGGHPMAGKEISGIDQANANLFARAPYALIGNGNDPDPRLQSFVELIRAIGAEPVWCDAETHDWAVGIVSHLPQLVAVALARVVSDETDETGLPLALAGKGLQDMLRVAGSPYGVWRDVLVANRENVARALERLTQEIDHLRRNLSARELEEEFRAANTLYSRLRAEPDKCEG
jgi:prephenate dehydrogenase